MREIVETLFAKVTAFGEVKNIIVADQDYINTLPDADSYAQTFADANGNAAKRYNYAVIGGKFDPVNNVFVEPQPYQSWSLSAAFSWQAPTPMPDDGKPYKWDEPTLSWVEVE